MYHSWASFHVLQSKEAHCSARNDLETITIHEVSCGSTFKQRKCAARSSTFKIIHHKAVVPG